MSETESRATTDAPGNPAALIHRLGLEAEIEPGMVLKHQRALDELHQREFEQGRYNPVMPYPPELVDDTTPPGPGRQHETIKDALCESDADGSRSILDIDRVGNETDFGLARRLTEEELQAYLRDDDPHPPTNPRAAADRRHRARRSGLPHGLRRGRLSRGDLLRWLFVRLKFCRVGTSSQNKAGPPGSVWRPETT